MPAQALYLKWRSQTFEEIVGQEHVTQTLRHALERDKIAHAYLFCGPRGTGKTSTARILAKAVNCLSEDALRPCNACAICRAVNDGSLMDLIEIDAASNTGVDDIRELRDKIAFRPGQARYKIYIVDEVHMLSTSAFNALLKTLEEPPPHVIFILATTDPQKIPATVISRCQRFDFRFVPTSLIAGHLRHIADAEAMKAEQEALDLIAAHAGGAVRDAVTLLDQLTAYGDDGITAAHVQSILGIGESSLLGDFVDALIDKDMPAGLAVIDRLVDQGVQLRQFNSDLLDYLRGMVLIKAGGDARLLHLSPDARQRLRQQAGKPELSDLVRYARLFSDSAVGLRGSLQPQLPLELAFLEAVGMRVSAPEATVAAPRPAAETAPAKATPSGGVKPASPVGAAPRELPRPKPAEPMSGMPLRPEMPPQPAFPEKAAAQAPAGGGASVSLDDVQRTWPELLRQLRPISKDAEAFLRSAQPTGVEAGVVSLSFKGEFAKENFEKRGCVPQVGEVMSQVLGQSVSVRCFVAGKEPAGAPKKPAESPSAAPASVVRETPAPKPAAGAAEDPLVQAAKQMGGRVKQVKPRAAPADEPPLPDEPPPFDDLG